MSSTVAEILVDQMVEAGIRKVYGIVGDSANPIVDALRRHEADIEFVHVRNEEAGAFAAGADAQISGRPTAVLGSSGPGQRAPAQRPLRLPAQRRAGVRDRHAHPERRDRHRLLPGDEARSSSSRTAATTSARSARASQMPRISELALQAAILGRGVGHGDPARRHRAPPRCEHELIRHPLITQRPVIRPADADLDRAASLIARAERDRDLRRRRHPRRARRGARAVRASSRRPIGYAYRGKDVLEADNPNAVGMTGLLGWGGATEALGDCDLVLMLGTDFFYHAFLPAAPTIIQVDDNAVAPRPAGERRPRPHRRRRRDAARAAPAARAARRDTHVPRQDRQAPPQGREAPPDLRRRTRAAATDCGPRWWRPRSATSPTTTRCSPIDTGMCNVWGARYLHMKPGRRLLASFGHGSMANAMPQAIGAKVGSPDRQVIALCGDGGFSMLMGELLTAAGLDIPVKLMIFNNSTLGMVRAEMMVVGYQPWGTDVKNPDFGAIATAAGMHGERVENADDIRPAITRPSSTPVRR